MLANANPPTALPFPLSHSALFCVLTLGTFLAACDSGGDDSTSDAKPAKNLDAKVPDAGSDASDDHHSIADDPTVDHTPIAGLETNRWNFVPIDGMRCRDGSATGIAVNPIADADHLVVFLDGGGACFNPATCAMNPAKWDLESFAKFNTGPRSVAGIFNRDNDANPVRNWSYVYIPYCTGDIHGGNNPSGSVPDVPEAQHFVGYENVHQLLGRVVPTFRGVKSVLLTGQSAGGFGSTLNYVQVARAFAPVTVNHLNDSGPMLAPPYLAECLSGATQAWNFDRVRDACGDDCQDLKLFSVQKHIVEHHPRAAFGLLDDTGDWEVRLFFGFGIDNCAPSSAGMSITPEVFTEGLLDMRAKLANHANFGAFIFHDTEHTTLTTDASFYARTSAGTKLTDWIAQLVNEGTVANVGP